MAAAEAAAGPAVALQFAGETPLGPRTLVQALVGALASALSSFSSALSASYSRRASTAQKLAREFRLKRERPAAQGAEQGHQPRHRVAPAFPLASDMAAVHCDANIRIAQSAAVKGGQRRCRRCPPAAASRARQLLLQATSCCITLMCADYRTCTVSWRATRERMAAQVLPYTRRSSSPP